MKANFLFILLSVFFILPIDASTHTRTRKVKIHHTAKRYYPTRAPLEFNIAATEEEGTLKIIFGSSLPDAVITITDRNGNTIVDESLTYIEEGKTLYIYNANAYPYALKITSPLMDVTGEIVKEEISE